MTTICFHRGGAGGGGQVGEDDGGTGRDELGRGGEPEPARAAGDDRTVVEALDPLTMVEVTGNGALRAVAEDAAGRLRAALDALGAP